MMNFSVSSLLASFIFGVFGIYVFREGKRRADLSMVFIGLALMLYTYFTNSPWLDWGIGTALLLWFYQIY
jgi:glucose uptake protein GlcU